LGGNRDEVQAAMQEVASNKVIESYENLVKSLTVGQQTVLQKIHTASKIVASFYISVLAWVALGKAILQSACVLGWNRSVERI